MFLKYISFLLVFLTALLSVSAYCQEDFIEELKSVEKQENYKKPAENTTLPAFADDAVTPTSKNASSASSGKVCSYCGGSGVCEIAGERIPCPVCNGKNAADKPVVQEKKEKFPKVKSEDRLPWDPAHSPSDPLPLKRGRVTVAKKEKFESRKINFRSDRLPPAGDRLVFISAREVPAATVKLSTVWGVLSFASRGAYHSDLYRGPGFSISVPKKWHEEEKPHAVLGGIQHRYTAPDGMSYIVVVTFPLTEEVNLADYLQKKHVKMLSSFKNRSAQKMILGRRKGIGAFYEGILMMRDVACNLFFTRYKKKGYVVYGLYFDHEGGVQISQIINSLRIY